MLRASELAATRIALAVALTIPAGAHAQRPAPHPAPPSAATSSAAPGTAVPATPQQTTASFADWTLRCTQTGSGPRFCEVVQGIQQNDRPVAQIAFGRPQAGQKLQMTVLVPPNVSLQAGPTLLAGAEGEPAPTVTLSWRRCVPVGCIADAGLEAEVVMKLRGWTAPGRVVFLDAAGRPAGVPFSARGLAQALDALTKEEGAG